MWSLWFVVFCMASQPQDLHLVQKKRLGKTSKHFTETTRRQNLETKVFLIGSNSVLIWHLHKILLRIGNKSLTNALIKTVPFTLFLGTFGKMHIMLSFIMYQISKGVSLTGRLSLFDTLSLHTIYLLGHDTNESRKSMCSHRPISVFSIGVRTKSRALIGPWGHKLSKEKKKKFTFGLPIPSRYHDYGIARTPLPRYTWLHPGGKWDKR